MKIYTFQLGKWRKVKALGGVRIIDTTVRSGYKPLAPTWEMVQGVKAGLLSEESYTQQYYEILEYSRKTYPRFWAALFEQPAIALGCYCKAGDFCHRHLLKDYLLQQISATDDGEIE